MLRSPHYRLDDVTEVRRLVAGHPWATFVSATSQGLVASHYPVVLDPADPDGLTLVSHFGRPDDEYHELGRHEVLVVVAGAHDYVSPSWYPAGELVPTWNHVTAHLYGTPEVLDEEENYRMLCHLTDHFERGREGGRSLLEDEEGTRRTARGTRGLRLRVTRFEARWKLSQTKPATTVANVVRELEPVNPDLAAEMRAVHPGCPVRG
ncbi:FMN-binding negative transcriptional regulator [Kineococcus rhizosphaerae]|uniref:PaiB family negative transcriptional regulator n=1 Tax=Kineococcus rhizosphaerae TaxID=559628 RepID=A0A2T0RBK7_9ACTN|nr:FMN-binding negative transcriptional regulator [Kineococcus rhizosphaerae]PRY18529.1 PaiB family negative transcriptional regulator [Kineococcus rhizosphaerae]